jgi:hypothetical protein
MNELNISQIFVKTRMYASIKNGNIKDVELTNVMKSLIPFVAFILIGAIAICNAPKQPAAAIQPFVSQCETSLGADAGVCR